MSKFEQINEKTIWLIVIIIFTLISNYPIWSVKFLPMQDYPQHIMQVHILSSKNDLKFDYKYNYDINFRLFTYSTFYLITSLLSLFMPVETAGKLSISLYIFGVVLLLLKLEHRFKTNYLPWGLLILFPFAFNQQYYLGNINFCYSLPLLIFTLLDHEAFSTMSLKIWPLCRHILWQFFLFITHPFTFVIYIVLAVFSALITSRKSKIYYHSFILPFIAGALFLIWFFLQNVSSVAFSTGTRWMNTISDSLVYYGYIFTGMRWYDGVDKVLVSLWIIIGFLTVHAIYTNVHKIDAGLQKYFMFFIITFLAVFILPFQIGHVTFLNLRFAAISYFFLALMTIHLRFKSAFKVIIIILITGVLINSVIKQYKISNEIEEIRSIIAKIPPNSSILPIVFDNDSPELDRTFFDIHLHDHNYYHLLVGGGINPYFPKQPFLPVHYKPGINLSGPGEYQPYKFRWEKHSSDYQYFLVRGAPKKFIFYLELKTELIHQNGRWQLFKK